MQFFSGGGGRLDPHCPYTCPPVKYLIVETVSNQFIDDSNNLHYAIALNTRMGIRTRLVRNARSPFSYYKYCNDLYVSRI